MGQPTLLVIREPVQPLKICFFKKKVGNGKQFILRFPKKITGIIHPAQTTAVSSASCVNRTGCDEQESAGHRFSASRHPIVLE
jgi:hypothetical protein